MRLAEWMEGASDGYRERSLSHWATKREETWPSERMTWREHLLALLIGTVAVSMIVSQWVFYFWLIGA